MEFTDGCWDHGLVALCAHGSFVDGEPDEWSDLDLCLLRENSEEALSAGRRWATTISQELGPIADPMLLPLDALSPCAHWGIATFAWSLRHRSRLLRGRDVRPQIAEPSEQMLLVNALSLALLCVRRIYEIDRGNELPAVLGPVSLEPDRSLPGGHMTWQLYTAAIQLLRAIVFLEDRCFCPAKSRLREHLAAAGDRELRAALALASRTRAAVPRFEAVVEVPACARPLAVTIPKLCARLRDNMASRGLPDPSHEPATGPLYRTDGSPVHTDFA